MAHYREMLPAIHRWSLLHSPRRESRADLLDNGATNHAETGPNETAYAPAPIEELTRGAAKKPYRPYGPYRCW